MKQMNQKPIWKRLLAAFLVLAIQLCIPIPRVSAAGSYPTKDMFGTALSLKGIQGIVESTARYGKAESEWANLGMSDMGTMSHSFLNVNLNECIFSPEHEWAKRGFIEAYEFEGEVFYFAAGNIINNICRMNNNNLSVSIAFWVRWTETSEGYGNMAIDEWNRDKGIGVMYAPAISGYNGKAVRAFWYWFMEELVENECHVDNFILGNEVNVPNLWNYCGSTDPDRVVSLYTEAFYGMWRAVREYTDVSRCSVCLDHNWSWGNDPNGFGGKTFLDLFDEKVKAKNDGYPVDWSISYHPYPAQLYHADIWNEREGIYGLTLTTNSIDTPFIDGSNLAVLTNYVRENFGEEHRIMLTEQGFTRAQGEAVQAASLAYSYYAAMYDPMVDSFVIHYSNDGTVSTAEGSLSLDFRLLPLAQEVYRRIGSGSEEDANWIAQLCLPVIGVQSWNEIIPNFGQNIDKYKPAVNPAEPQVREFVSRMYTVALNREAEEKGLNDWSRRLLTHRVDGAGIANGFIMSEEFKKKNVSDETYVDILYRTFFDREADAEGRNTWMERLTCGNSREYVLAGFVNSVEFDQLCNRYNIIRGSMQTTETAIGPGVSQFVERCYNKVLGRSSDAKGLADWVGGIARGEQTPESTAKFFFYSEEYTNKGTSDEEFVETLYQTFMNRGSDPAGKSDWVGQLSGGTSREQVLEGFSRSEEFANILQSFGL